MSPVSHWVLPLEVLIPCLNAAVTSLIACGIAVSLNRRVAWSLPTRHILLVAALAISLTAPLFVPLVHLPSLWAINGSATIENTSPAIANRPREFNRDERPAELPIALTIQVADTYRERPNITESSVVAPIASANPDAIKQAPIPKQRPSAETSRTCTIGTFFCWLWFVGMTVGLTKVVNDVIRLYRWMQTTTVTESATLCASASSAANHVGLRNPVPVYCSGLLSAPVAFGLFRPRIVLPNDLERNLPPDQLRAVLLHEMAHIARGDLWIGLLQQAAAIVYWWNPLVLLANRQLADFREQICDDIAICELPQPDTYATTLVDLAERCSRCIPVPATLGFGSSGAGQLENRIRHIVSSTTPRCVRLTRLAIGGVSATVVLMTATILLAQVQVKSPTTDKPVEQAKQKEPERPREKSVPAPAGAPVISATTKKPTRHDLIQTMAAYEQMYLPYDIKSMETFRFPDDLTPQERASNLRADGRKHQRLMEYAQLTKRIWRRKETSLIDDEVSQGPYERFSDGERIVQVSPGPAIINGKTTLEIYIDNRKNGIENYLHAQPLCGVFCLSAYSASELFSNAFQDNEDAVELVWDNGDAKLSFVYGQPDWNTRFVLWLSKNHAWHPIRWQRYMDAKDELFFDEWEVTKFARQGKLWRVAEGSHRYRARNYSMDFKVLEQKYGSEVDERQFRYEIPAGAKIRDDQKSDADPPPVQTREMTINVASVSGEPIPQASVRVQTSPSRELDAVLTDDQGVARSTKAPTGNVTVRIAAADFRPVTWVVGSGNELKAIMVPISPGVVVDEGKPVADAWITNESLQIRADGFTYVPTRDWEGREKDWSNSEGRFELKTNLTLRRRDAVFPLIAVNPNRDKMAIRFVPARELGAQQTLDLQRVCHVSGHCLLQGMTDAVEIGIGLESSLGQSIGFLTTRKELTPAGLRVDFHLRLPPGDYVLKSRQSSHHSGFSIPITVPTGKSEMDLGTITVPANGTIALRGKAAPELEFQWRSGQETNWEKLRGKVVVLDFWGTWCKPCVNDMPLLMDVAEQFREKPVEWLSVHTPNLTTFEELDRRIAICQEKSWNKRPLPFTTVIDRPMADNEYSGRTSHRYDVAEWPTLIVVDQRGQVVGPIPKEKLAETIRRLLANETER